MRRFLVLVVWACLLLPVTGAGDTKQAFEFATEMARAGSWHEALFRWDKVFAEDPENPHLLNNLAVAHEALGHWDEAAAFYAKALAGEPDSLHIQENRRRFSLIRERVAQHQGAAGPSADAGPTPDGTEARRKGKVFRVTVGLPMPPRLKLEGSESILVVSFLDDETKFLDINREMVRFLRSTFRSRTAHPILDIVPAPAIPEQTPDDLLANAEFWKFLHREYDADLIVSGVLRYDREDASSYKEVDVVSATTGQKVRQTVFVEQEKFNYNVEVFFIDGPTGRPLHRDRLQRSALVQGTQNDPITTFFDMSNSIAEDVLAAITTRIRSETRIVFKN